MGKNEFRNESNDQEQLIKELKDELKLKNQCLALLAHDFVGTSRNFLWVINSLEDGSISPEILNSILPELKANVQTNQQTIDSTVAWVNAQHRDFKIQPTDINLFALFSSIRECLSSYLKNKEITLQFEEDPDTSIESDAFLISFIVKKTIENAVKYSRKGQAVTVYVEKTDEQRISIIVEDKGVGMNENIRSNLFTLNGSTYTGTSNEKGAGLSLIIANDFAKLIKGSLTINSVENYGTRIEINLPVCLR